MISKLLKVLLILAAGCGGATGFQLTAEDNDQGRLAAAFKAQEVGKEGPQNVLGRPLAFLVARGKPRSLIAFDLEQKKTLWRIDDQIESRVVVGVNAVAYIDGQSKVVARDVRNGNELWRVDAGGKLVGLAADGRHAYVTVERSGSPQRWTLRGLSMNDGSEDWHIDAPGALGAPVASGGLVFSPFLKQWLAVIDGSSGEQLVRIRGIDEEISFARATPKAVYFGSQSGVFLLDERAASGVRAQSTYGKVAVPKELSKARYYFDGFDPVQANYSAYDRNRILWRGEKKSDDLGFTDDRVVVHVYRYLFGLNPADGSLTWAYSVPRVDGVASEHLGKMVLVADMLGNLTGIDPSNGNVVYTASVGGQLSGGTFDADGFVGKETVSSKSTTAGALAMIAVDKDARFGELKQFAVSSLAGLQGGDVAKDLVNIMTDGKNPAFIRQAASKAMAERKDPSVAAALIEGLSKTYDFVQGVEPTGIGDLADVAKALPADKLEGETKAKLVASLTTALWEPGLLPEDAARVASALGNLGGAAAVAPLRNFAFLYRHECDVGTLEAITQLGALGPAGKQALWFIAQDARSNKSCMDKAQDVLRGPSDKAEKPAPAAK